MRGLLTVSNTNADLARDASESSNELKGEVDHLDETAKDISALILGTQGNGVPRTGDDRGRGMMNSVRHLKARLFSQKDEGMMPSSSERDGVGVEESDTRDAS
jgi:hypothetical protein